MQKVLLTITFSVISSICSCGLLSSRLESKEASPKNVTHNGQSSNNENAKIAEARSETPVGFKYYRWSTAGTTNRSHSSSIVIKGRIGGDKTEISLGQQDQIGGSVVSDFDWSGKISGDLNREVLRVVEATDLQAIDSAPLNTGAGGIGIEVTLLYKGNRERAGKPSNAEDWKRLLSTIEQEARKSKTRAVTANSGA